MVPVEGVVVQYSGDSIISENNISGVKTAKYNNGNGIIVANNSDNVIVYKNKVTSSVINIPFHINTLVPVCFRGISAYKRITATTNVNTDMIVANNSDNVIVYKNKVTSSGNHGIQVTYSSENVTVPSYFLPEPHYRLRQKPFLLQEHFP